ncbi:MAG: penicillin-binding transpeptidase domain-containing protein, partial [Paracoccus sp. (in: a-proteobacteria)]
IRLQESVGRDMVRKVAEDFGFASDMANGPSLGLGVSESTLLEITGAYAGIRNGGTSVSPYGLVELRIKGDDQPLMGQAGGMGERVISPRAAGQLIYMMEQVIQNGTGGRAKLPGREAAGKTGTTSSYRDAWFIGFTEQYVTGVWMGYDDNTPLKGVTGGGLPAEIWQAVMTEIHDGLPALPLSTVSPDGSGVVVGSSGSQQIVTSGSADDPLAAALAEAIRDNQPRQQPAQQPGTAPRTPGNSTSAGDDPLSQALNGILGRN